MVGAMRMKSTKLAAKDVSLGRQPRMPKSKAGAQGRLLPTGECWCGCGATTPVGSFFLSGHDKRAESAVILVEFGGVPEFLRAMRYGPGGKNAQNALATWKKSSNRRR